MEISNKLTKMLTSLPGVMRSRTPTTFQRCTSTSTRSRMDTGGTEVLSGLVMMMPSSQNIPGEVTDLTHSCKMR